MTSCLRHKPAPSWVSRTSSLPHRSSWPVAYWNHLVFTPSCSKCVIWPPCFHLPQVAFTNRESGPLDQSFVYPAASLGRRSWIYHRLLSDGKEQCLPPVQPPKASVCVSRRWAGPPDSKSPTQTCPQCCEWTQVPGTQTLNRAWTCSCIKPVDLGITCYELYYFLHIPSLISTFLS